MTHSAFLQAVFRGENDIKAGPGSPHLCWKACLGSDYFLAFTFAKLRLCQLCSMYKMGLILLAFCCVIQSEIAQCVKTSRPASMLIACDPLFASVEAVSLSMQLIQTSGVSLKPDYCLL